MTRERILFICTANLDRSRAAEDLYAADPRYEVRSAGTAPYATRVVDRDLVNWADRIFVMNERYDGHRTHLLVRYPGLDRPVIDLDVEDRWPRTDPALRRLLLQRLTPHLGRPQPPTEKNRQ